MNKRNFLLGYGERLTQSIPPILGGGEKIHPYTFDQAVIRLTSKAISLADIIGELPIGACPRDEAVGIFTLHPSYIAKSYFPAEFLQSSGLRSIGSKATIIKPEKWTKKGSPEPEPTVEVFVAGKRDRFKKLAENLHEQNYRDISKDIAKIEDIRYFAPGERIRITERSKKENIKLEIALHVDGGGRSEYIMLGFKKYLHDLDASLDLDRRIMTNGLCFIPALATFDSISNIEKFSFLRVFRHEV